MQISRDSVWQRRKGSSPFHETVSFLDERLVLGADTVLLKLETNGPARVTLNSDAGHDRLVALLAVAGRGRLTRAALSQLDASLADWRRGDRALAAIRLAFASLPRIRDHDDAYRLFLAETALDAGLWPNELLRELGYSGCTALLKFNPGQLRVPAGSGRRSGRWTSGDESGGVSDGPAIAPNANAAPARGGEDSSRVTPVLFRPEGGDAEEHDIREKERRLGIGETIQDRIDDGHVLVRPAPMLVVPPGLVAPGTSIITGPSPTLAPAGGGPKPGATTTRDDDGLACPKQENDVPNGRNPSGDEFEYLMSLLINPEGPTPKQSMAAPNVTSQAYFLSSATPSGRTSFDDCKQRNTPTTLPIPGLRPGDLFEEKAVGWGWVLANKWTSGYNDFERQVENQNEAVTAEGRGRQVYYCLGDQVTANLATRLYGLRYRNSHFLVCH